MSQNPVVDIAIALALMYLLLSLTCTVVNEYIATKLKLRSKQLEVALREILDDPDTRSAFYSHGLIAGAKNAVARAGGLMPMGGSARPAPAPAAGAASQPGTHPSYVSTETFVLALVGGILRKDSALGRPVPDPAAPKPPIPTFDDLQSAVQNLPPSKMKDALVTSMTVAQGNFDQFRKHVATWFDDSMDRLSGAYKRDLKLISIVVGCLVAAVLNADTFEVGRTLWSDGALRTKMVDVAQKQLQLVTPPAEPSPSPDSGAEATVQKERENLLNKVRKGLQDDSDLLRPLPIGWPMRKDPGDPVLPWLLLKLAGLFVTGLALSLGAPFWFDTLSKFMNLRAAGVKPERQP